MSNFKNQIEEARADAQHLQEKLAASTAKHDTAIRAEARDVAAEANELARNLQTILGGEQVDVKRHLQTAGSQFEQIAQEAQERASASESNLKSDAAASAQKARMAVAELSQALAKKRANHG